MLKRMVKKTGFWWAIAVACSALIASCNNPATTPPNSTVAPTQATQTTNTAIITADGSSTVYPITEEVVQEYRFENANAPEVKVEFSGTSGGFKKFCAGETDISNASRPIRTAEMEACRAAGIEYIELPVAYDALTIVVHPSNTWANDITTEELKKLWEPAAEGKVMTWNQVRSDWPNQPIKLYGPGTDSGTFDYFTEAIVGETDASRKDYTASEDDDVLVRGVRNDPDGLGYFGYAYYEENARVLKALPVNNGGGPIEPSFATVIAGQYQPLARPLFIYVNAKSAQDKPELRAFVEYYMKRGRELVNVVGYVPLPDEAYNQALVHFQNNRVGTVFAGKSETTLTIEELLKRETVK